MRKTLLLFVLIVCVSLACKVKTNNAETSKSEKFTLEDYGIENDGFDILKGKSDNKDNALSLISPQIGQVEYRHFSSAFEYIPVKQDYKYTIVTKDSALQYFIYEPNLLSYVIYDFTDKSDIKIQRHRKEIIEKDNVAELTITSEMMGVINKPAADSSVNLLADVVDYYDLEAGDKISIAYSQKYAGKDFLNIQKIKALKVENGNEEQFAILFEEDGKLNFFTETGKKVTPRFISAPLERYRISSRFSLKRKHPVTKRVKPHYGTDFAAPIGTPILSTADGVVARVASSRGNGKYVIIKHDEIYSTQYLHMSKFAKGLRKGHKVSKGQVIGYVGKSGLATGPHLCYRFWVNGVQVDPLHDKDYRYENLTAEYFNEFEKVKEQVEEELFAKARI